MCEQHSPMVRRLLKIEEAADRLGVCRAEVYKYLNSGTLASVKLGAARRIPSWLLDEFMVKLVAEQVEDQEAPPKLTRVG